MHRQYVQRTYVHRTSGRVPVCGIYSRSYIYFNTLGFPRTQAASFINYVYGVIAFLAVNCKTTKPVDCRRCQAGNIVNGPNDSIISWIASYHTTKPFFAKINTQFDLNTYLFKYPIKLQLSENELSIRNRSGV